MFYHSWRILGKNQQKLLVSFYRCSIESILTYCICRREEGAPEDRQHGAEDYRMSPHLPGRPVQFPLSQEAKQYSQRPGHTHCELLPSGRRYR